jgi:crossover junction endodeoxyribonuclease RuvC
MKQVPEVEKSPGITVVGIDPGLANTGYAVLREINGKISFQEGGIISTPSNRPLEDRLKEIFLGLTEVVASFEPDLVAVEDLYSDYQNPASAVLMGHARGVCLLAASSHSVPVASYRPTRVKKSLTGNGRASKQQVKSMVKVVLQLPSEPHSEHVADAIAVALCHLRERQVSAIIQGQR